MTVGDGEASHGDDVGDQEECDLNIALFVWLDWLFNYLLKPDNNDPAETHSGHRQARSSDKHVCREGGVLIINYSY